MVHGGGGQWYTGEKGGEVGNDARGRRWRRKGRSATVHGGGRGDGSSERREEKVVAAVGRKEGGEDHAGVEEKKEERKKYVPINVPPGEMLRSPTFWIVWLTYGIGAGAGLMVIGSVAGMAKRSLGESAFLAVAILAVGNAGGRYQEDSGFAIGLHG